MKSTLLTSCLLVIGSKFSWSQTTPGESFFDKYLPIAQLFDSPVFFGCVIGSAVVLLIVTLLILKYASLQEKKAEEWGTEKSPKTIVGLLDSPIPEEARLAYIYLRNHGTEENISLITELLEDQRRRGSINSSLIFLLEELETPKAISLFQQIANGKSQFADLAQRAAEHLIDLQEEENKESAKQPAKSS